MIDVEAIVLQMLPRFWPDWQVDMSFTSKSECQAFTGSDFRDIAWVAQEDFDRSGGHIDAYRARYVELLDGVVLAQLLMDRIVRLPITHRTGLKTINTFLSWLRAVPWSPENAWMFPMWHNSRNVFILWIGQKLGLCMCW